MSLASICSNKWEHGPQLGAAVPHKGSVGRASEACCQAAHHQVSLVAAWLCCVTTMNCSRVQTAWRVRPPPLLISSQLLCSVPEFNCCFHECKNTQSKGKPQFFSQSGFECTFISGQTNSEGKINNNNRTCRMYTLTCSVSVEYELLQWVGVVWCAVNLLLL